MNNAGRAYPQTKSMSYLRAFIGRDPEALYREARELARFMRCSEAEMEEIRRLIVEDGLEVVA